MWYIIGAIIALLVIVFALRMVVDVLCAVLSLINAGLGSLVRMDQKSRDKRRWDQAIRNCQQTERPVINDAHPPAATPWLIAAAIVLVFGMAFVLSGCASAPPAAVSEYRAPQYVQRPAPQPYCDDECQVAKQLTQQQEERRRAETAERRQKVASQPPASHPMTLADTGGIMPRGAVLYSMAKLRGYGSTRAELMNAPIPGMPDLSKTVYLRKGSLICDDDTYMLATAPMLEGAVRRGDCIVTGHTVRVLVFSPSGDAVLQARMFHFIAIELQTRKSEANVAVAWTKIKNLSNRPAR